MALKDLPDYTKEITLTGLAGFTGLEELAVRLGSIVPWDMKGNIVLMEDFESELTEWTDGSDSPCTATRSSRHKFSGDWSLKLNYPSALGVKNIRAYRDFHFPGMVKYAAFARFCLGDGSNIPWLFLELYNSETLYIIDLRWDGSNITFSVITTGGAYQDIPGCLTFIPGIDTWFPIMITFDLKSGYYDKLYISGQEFDISDIPLYSEPSVGRTWGYFEVGVQQASEGAIATYVDDIIIAKNVP
jgi:hypothetical protein